MEGENMNNLMKQLGICTAIYRLAIKYWYQGDTWEDAVEFAKRIVNGFK